MGERSHTPTEQFGPYQVFEKIGIGGMAVVHRAVKAGIAGFVREVALKRLLPHQAENQSLVEAFVREAKLAAKLRHPNIAHVYELGKVEDTYFISMEYVEGHDVRDILRQLARERMFMPIRVAVAILVELCDALDYAHNRTDDVTGEPLGIVHRDISPSNLVITEGGHLKVIDFGIAKGRPRELATSSGRVKGKFGYMSPESLRGDDPDARSDIFSAGVVAHEILTTRRLFGATYNYDTIRRMHMAESAPPSAHNPKVPRRLDQIVMRALERDPEDRWQSADEMRSALYQVVLEDQLDATSDSTADYLDFLFGGPVELIIDPPSGHPDDQLAGWLAETDVESVEEIDDFLLVEASDQVQPVDIELPPVQFDRTPTGRFDIGAATSLTPPPESLLPPEDDGPSRG
jgi:serine/threonine protein kinase